MRRQIDWSLYLVTDRELSLGRSLVEVVESAVQGGVSVVQLREKDISSREFVQLGQALLKILKPKNVPLIINDRADIALAIKADGLHIGQGDLHYNDARAILGPDYLIGLSVENETQMEEARSFDVDYLALSPVFPTPTKTDTAPPWGLEGIKRARTLTTLPLVTIGGINLKTASDVLRAGADGLAIVSAICSAPSPAEASREFVRLIQKEKRKSL